MILSVSSFDNSGIFSFIVYIKTISMFSDIHTLNRLKNMRGEQLIKYFAYLFLSVCIYF